MFKHFPCYNKPILITGLEMKHGIIFRLGISIIAVTVLGASLVAAPTAARADSPVTSTPFATAYTELGAVAQSLETGMLSLETAQFLSDWDVPVDAKAAMCNALGWDINGKDNAVRYGWFLALKYWDYYDGPPELNDTTKDLLTADELMCMGYLMALDDYFHPARALPWLQAAREKRPESYTIAMIEAIVKGQAAMDNDWPSIWNGVEIVLNNESLKVDMRPEAIAIICDYMVLYQDDAGPKG